METRSISQGQAPVSHPQGQAPSPASASAGAQAMRDLRIQQLQKRTDEAMQALKEATEGDPELIAFEERLEQLAREEKQKGPGKHLSSLAWRRACVAMMEIFEIGMMMAARRMAHLLDEDGAPSSWAKQYASLKNWRRSFAAGKLGDRDSLLDFVEEDEGRYKWGRVARIVDSSTPGPHRALQELERYTLA